MTLIETPRPAGPAGLPTTPAAGERVRARRRDRGMSRASLPGTRPSRSRRGGAPLRYRGAGVLMSRTPHRARPITPATTVMLALLAAVITVWLGLVAHFGAAAAGGTAAGMPDQVGVVRVEAGEGLQQLAARVAPGAPTAQMVDRIRELNRLDSVVLDAGQTLIAPVD